MGNPYNNKCIAFSGGDRCQDNTVDKTPMLMAILLYHIPLTKSMVSLKSLKKVTNHIYRKVWQ